MVRPNKETIRSSTIPYGLEDEGLAKRIYGVNSKESIEKLGKERKEILKEYQKGDGELPQSTVVALKLLDHQIEYYKNNQDKEYVKSYYETRAGKAEKEYFLDQNLDYRDIVAERISNETDGD